MLVTAIKRTDSEFNISQISQLLELEISELVND